jgi:putative endonuclease
MPFYVYIMTNEAKTLYIGVTNDLARRVHEHKTGTVSGFTSRYKLNRLAWYDTFDRVVDAIAHEKRLKRWNRAWKLDLIETVNPGWEDLIPPW